MKRFFILTCMITALGCSSTGNIKIVSPSTPENEAKEEISKAPVTKLDVVSVPERAPDQKTSRQKTAAEVRKTEAGKVADHAGGEPVPSLTSEHSLEALISLLEKKGIIKKEELLRELKELEKKGK